MNQFDHERLDAYRAAIEFVGTADRILEQIPPGRGYLKDQLGRAALSIVNNTAEGAGEFKPSDKARFYRMACRSATQDSPAEEIGDGDGDGDGDGSRMTNNAARSGPHCSSPC
ncbi:MAG TPA: four helix bundle protein [Polyangiaceae bacterium]|jgi:hypothetical protein|nr:four helix bundle protein [Polyangiaceae bacterium]